MSHCEEIKEKFEDIKADANHIEELLEQYQQTGSKEDKQGLAEALEALDFEKLEEQLRERVEHILSHHPQADQFPSKIVIEDGQAIIDGDIDFYLTFTNYFPQVISEISGDGNFNRSTVEDLSNIRKIGGRAKFSDAKIKNLSNLKTIGGYARFEYSEVKDLSNLREIGGYADFTGSVVENISNLETIDGYANFKNSKVNDISSLQKVDGDVFIDENSDLDFSGVQITGEIKRE